MCMPWGFFGQHHGSTVNDHPIRSHMPGLYLDHDFVLQALLTAEILTERNGFHHTSFSSLLVTFHFQFLHVGISYTKRLALI